MIWYDASIAVPATDDVVDMIILDKDVEVLVQGYYNHENWISGGEYIYFNCVLRWRSKLV